MKRFVHQISRHPRKNVIHNICLKKTDIKQIDYCQHMQRYACVEWRKSKTASDVLKRLARKSKIFSLSFASQMSACSVRCPDVCKHPPDTDTAVSRFQN